MVNSQAKSVVLTIAGSDPGGGAGIQADLKTFAALGVYGYSAITQVIAQNSSMVREIRWVSPRMIARQVELLARERRPNEIKVGALGGAAAVRSVVQVIENLRLAAPVVDPVIVSSAGVRLLDRGGEAALVKYLIPLAKVITPNVAEAQALTGIRITNDERMRAAAQRLVLMGARAVVIKGGHRGGPESSDLMFDGQHVVWLRARRIAGPAAHGTGCAFSAAIAAYLARGVELEGAVREAKRYVNAALKKSFKFGRGRPLLEHFVGLGSRWSRIP
jgi:hydroxymethylpyrimidine/phosphomethylpyrimidine kinase